MISEKWHFEWDGSDQLLNGGFRFGEWINQGHAAVAETTLVASYHGQLVNERRRRLQSIEDGHWLLQTHAAPAVGHLFVHRQYAVGEIVRKAC